METSFNQLRRFTADASHELRTPLSVIRGIDVRAEGSHALLTVTDRGPGVPVEYRERIFDRFFRIDEGRSRDHGGTGLGLAIAKWAVEANGGRLTVDAGPRGGSAFRIALPLKGEQL